MATLCWRMDPRIQHANGTIENLPTCEYPRYTPSGELAPPTITYSWIEAATTSTSDSYGELTATWTVPPAPTSNDGQTIYLFPGFSQTNPTKILEPVLGWNADFAGAWGMASWNCCPGGITTESTPVSVSTGDKLKGTVLDSCSAGTLSCPKWKVVTTDGTTSKSTTLASTSSAGHTFNWADAGALEVYNIVQCSDYPPDGQLTFSSLRLCDYNFDEIADPHWSATNYSSGLTPECGYGVQVAAKQVTVDYATFVTLNSFNGADGEEPDAGLVQTGDGNLHGTTLFGEADSYGTVFRITASGALTENARPPADIGTPTQNRPRTVRPPDRPPRPSCATRAPIGRVHNADRCSRNGEITPPCGVPIFVTDHRPSSDTPAFTISAIPSGVARAR